MSEGPRFIPVGVARALAGGGVLLDGAACVGAAPAFDTDLLPGETYDDRDQRVADAERTCARCPALDRCADLVTPRTHSVVLAGRRRGPMPRPSHDRPTRGARRAR